MTRWILLATVCAGLVLFLFGCGISWVFEEGKTLFTIRHPWWGATVAVLWLGLVSIWRAAAIAEGGCKSCAKKQEEIERLRDAVVRS